METVGGSKHYVLSNIVIHPSIKYLLNQLIDLFESLTINNMVSVTHHALVVFFLCASNIIFVLLVR